MLFINSIDFVCFLSCLFSLYLSTLGQAWAFWSKKKSTVNRLSSRDVSVKPSTLMPLSHAHETCTRNVQVDLHCCTTNLYVWQSDVVWVIGVRGGLQFCRPQKSSDAWCPIASLSPHFPAPSWLPIQVVHPFRPPLRHWSDILSCAVFSCTTCCTSFFHRIERSSVPAQVCTLCASLFPIVSAYQKKFESCLTVLVYNVIATITRLTFFGPPCSKLLIFTAFAE